VATKLVASRVVLSSIELVSYIRCFVIRNKYKFSEVSGSNGDEHKNCSVRSCHTAMSGRQSPRKYCSISTRVFSNDNYM
jgi:hypothetical protein